ncbi:hypothetical protein EXIGLDRAFT_568862, partial [Exidia glandulosa HHB12029]
SPLIDSAVAHVRQHTSLSTLNHCLRSVYWAQILLKRLPPPHEPINVELLAYACIMHDLGWAITPGLCSADKRFEVDSANQAVSFLAKHPAPWDRREREVLWTAIALHTTPSIGHHHPDQHIRFVQMGIIADFFGPDMPPPFPPGMITVEEYQEILTAFPRDGFKNELVGIMCGLCKDKAETTYDNFVGDFAKMYGLDGKGSGKEEYAAEWEKHQVAPMLLAGLDSCAQYE